MERESLRCALSDVHSVRDYQARYVVGGSLRTDSWGKWALSWVGAPRYKHSCHVVRGSFREAMSVVHSARDVLQARCVMGARTHS